VGVFGIALGALVPPLLIEDGNLQSYVNQGITVAFIGLAAVIAMLPGVRETKEMRERDLKMFESGKMVEQESFIVQFKKVLKSKNMMAFLLLYFLYQSLTQSMTGSIPYFVKFNLKMPQSVVTVVMAGFLVGALVSIPIWTKIGQKVNNNQKMILYGAILLILCTIPFIFIANYVAIVILMVFWGTGLGLFWAMTGPVMADVIDEIVVKSKKREEGVYMGFRAFFGRLAFVVQALNFWIVHSLTGFVEGSSEQTEKAIFGIHIHMALVPVILLTLGAFLYWKLNDLTPEKLVGIKKELAELKL
jgi:GPH family glycoside/pentoside/hexuronide:cation symporter